MDRLAITAEGPSSELATGFLGAVCERPAGWTYPAAHEPARFVPFDPEITMRAMRNAFGPVESHRPSLLRTIQELRAQLETARKKLAVVDYYSRWLPTKALAEIADIDAGRFDRKCPHCDFVTEYPLMFENHVKYGHGAGQKGGK